MNGLIAELENISEILFDNGYGSWGNAIRKAIAKLKEQQLDIDALKNTIQGMVEGQCIIAGDRRTDVVRCQDCKHGEHFGEGIWCKKYIPCHLASKDWFCADGEEKADV